MASGLQASPAGVLSPVDREQWAQWLAAEARRPNPFLTAAYAEAARAVAPGGEVARLQLDGETVGFWAFQQRGRAIQPLAAPLTDYQRLVTAPGVSLDLTVVLQAMRASRFCFNGLSTPRPPSLGLIRHTPMIADLTEGFDVYYARRLATYAKYFKDKQRQLRLFEQEHGRPTFVWHDDDPAVLVWLLDRKRAKFRATAQYDVFDCGWTERLLRGLLEIRTPAFGASISTMRAGGRLVAAVYTLRAGEACHVWFPTYDPDLGRHSPGAISLLNVLRLAAEEGVRSVDFGLEGEHYKQYFADPGPPVYEGCLGARAPVPLFGAPSSTAVDPSELNRIGRLSLKARRRNFVLTACEPRLPARALGFVSMAAAMARRQIHKR